MMTEPTLNSPFIRKFGFDFEITEYIFITFILYAYLIAACYLVDDTQMFVVPLFNPFSGIGLFVLISAQMYFVIIKNCVYFRHVANVQLVVYYLFFLS